MKITDIKIRQFNPDNPKMKAIVSIVIDGDFAVHDIKVVYGNDHLFVAMPSRLSNDGNYRDQAHPIGAYARKQIESKILAAYKTRLSFGTDSEANKKFLNSPKPWLDD